MSTNQPDSSIPFFFTYGIFQPGGLAFHRIRDYVARATKAKISGSLKVRDGLPLLDDKTTEDVYVHGYLLEFKQEQAFVAFDAISEMEPTTQYKWKQIDIGGKKTNVLLGKKMDKGAKPSEEDDWRGLGDPLFNEALELVQEISDQDLDTSRVKDFFRLQMAYLLLWTAIERYAQLRYYLGKFGSEAAGGELPRPEERRPPSIVAQLKKVAAEPAFGSALKKHVKRKKESVVFSVQGLDKESLVGRNGQIAAPEVAIDYYYQVRCNIAHRGKVGICEWGLVSDSLRELAAIFGDLLRAAKSDAERDEKQWERPASA